jgi:hypothetical protein
MSSACDIPSWRKTLGKEFDKSPTGESYWSNADASSAS